MFFNRSPRMLITKAFHFKILLKENLKLFFTAEKMFAIKNGSETDNNYL